MHAKNITNVSTSTSGADEALKWNNDSRSQPSASCWAATCSTPPKLKRVAQVRENRSLREKVAGGWGETGSGCRGLLRKGSLADAIQSCVCLVNLALGSFTKQLGLTLVSLHALKISSETQDDRGHRCDILVSESELSRQSSMMLENTAAGQDTMRSETLTIPHCCFMRLFAQLSSSDSNKKFTSCRPKSPLHFYCKWHFS